MHNLEVPAKFHTHENGDTSAFSLLLSEISRFRATVTGSLIFVTVESALVASGSGSTRQ